MPETDELQPIPQPGELSPAEQKMAEALALVQAGTGYQAAADHCKIPVKNLYRAAQRIYVSTGTREAALEAAEKRIEAQVTLIAEASGERVIEALATGAEVGKNDAVLYGIASDKIMRLRGLDRNHDRGGLGLETVMERLATLGLEAEVSIRPADPTRSARDVTPEADETSDDEAS